jgi:DNA-binding NtrC family response regulator
MKKNNIGRKKILVIEDEPIISRVCVKTLLNDGFEVDIASNGLVAMDMANSRVYDLYVSDIRTPKMNGIEFYQHLISKNSKLADRVILTTGDVLSSDVRDFLKDTNMPFLPKPFTPDELRAVVRKVLK